MRSTKLQTRTQQMHELILTVQVEVKRDQAEYKRFARTFPSLVHSCGLAQAVAFTEGKAPSVYIEHLATVLSLTKEQFMKAVHASDDWEYQLLTRNVLQVATWTKRLADALLEDEDRTEMVR